MFKVQIELYSQKRILRSVEHDRTDGDATCSNDTKQLTTLKVLHVVFTQATSSRAVRAVCR